MMLQVEVKKTPLNPSGPGELFLFRAKTAFLSSSNEGIEMRSEFSVVETFGLSNWNRRGSG